MRIRFWFLLFLLLLALAALAGLGYWLSTPGLQSFTPQDNAVSLPAGVEISLEFSQPMHADSVLQRISITPELPGNFTWQEKRLVFTPIQPWPPGTTVKVELAAGAQAAAWPYQKMLAGKQWSFRIRQPELAYLYPADGPANIYLLNSMSGQSSALTAGPGEIQDFTVNASGASIYYSTLVSANSSAIYRIDLPESLQAAPGSALPTPILIVDCPQVSCHSMTVSPNGEYLAYQRTEFQGDGNSQVWVLPLAGSNAPTAFLAGNPEHKTRLPGWSPEGWLTFYDATLQGFIIQDLKDGRRKFFTNRTGEPGAWQPTGSNFVAPEISFVDHNVALNLADLQTFANSHLILFNLLEERAIDLSSEEYIEDTNPAFSPDGASLAFARKFLDPKRWSPGRQIWLLRMGSKNPRLMTQEPNYNHFDLAWNPTGDQLAYVRFNRTTLTDPPEIWLMDPISGRAVRLITGGYAPQWIP